MFLKNIFLSYNPKQLQWVNYAKAITIILIVYRHTLTGLLGAGIYVNPYFVLANDAVLSFRMPLFMMLSGIFFSSSFRKRTYSGYVGNKISTILYPYIVWASIQLLIQIILSTYTNSVRSFFDFTYLVTHPRALDQFWFLYALFFITIFHSLLNYLLKCPKWVYVAIGLFLFGFVPYVEKIDFSFLLFYFYVFYALGDFFAKHLLDPKSADLWGSVGLLIIFFPLFFSIQYYWVINLDNNLNKFVVLIIGLIGSAFVLIICHLLDKYKLAKWLISIGQHSMPIYLMHVLVVAGVRVVLQNIFSITSPKISLPLSLILGIILPMIAYNIMLKKNMWWLFSLEKKTIIKNDKK